MTRNWKGPPRSKREFYDLAIKNHLCVSCLHHQPKTWKECPQCKADESHREYMPSMAELKRASQLIILQRSGHISRLTFHPRFDLKVNNVKICTYEADSSYYDEVGKYVVEDVKPPDSDFIAAESEIKINLFNALQLKHGISVKIFRSS